jgi:integrase
MALAGKPTSSSRRPPSCWDQELRADIKRELGIGWSVGPQSGRTKLTRRYPDGSRSSVMLDIPWTLSSKRRITNAVARLHQLMHERGLGLTEAHGICRSTDQPDRAQAESSAVDWPAIAEAFQATRADRRKATKRDLKRRVELALQTLQARPCPRDGRALMRNYAKQHFENCPPGGSGRRRHLGDVAAFLEYAVERARVDVRWRPLRGEELEELIGSADHGANEALTPPVKPEQLAMLLDDLMAQERSDIWLAVGLVGLYGLRPAELAALRVEGERLYVGGGIKRNARTLRGHKKGERLVLPLDIPGREGEGAKLLQLYASGLVQLPPTIQSAIASGEFKRVGNAFRKLLDSNRAWQMIVKSSPGVVPYSLRHGFAWRAHKCYARSLSIRDCSALLGHSPATHHRHYGRWTDESGLIEAVALACRPAESTILIGK